MMNKLDIDQLGLKSSEIPMQPDGVLVCRQRQNPISAVQLVLQGPPGTSDIHPGQAECWRMLTICLQDCQSMLAKMYLTMLA